MCENYNKYINKIIYIYFLLQTMNYIGVTYYVFAYGRWRNSKMTVNRSSAVTYYIIVYLNNYRKFYGKKKKNSIIKYNCHRLLNYFFSKRGRRLLFRIPLHDDYNYYLTRWAFFFFFFFKCQKNKNLMRIVVQ